MNASTLERLLLAEMQVHCFDEKVAPAYFGFRRNVLGVGIGGGGVFARVGHNQECVGIIECGQDQSIALPRSVGVRREGGRRVEWRTTISS